MPMKSFSTEPSRAPPSRASPPSNQAPFGGRQGPPARGRGPPSGPSAGPAASGPPGGSRPRGPSRSLEQSRPGARPSAQPQQASPTPAAPVRKSRRTTVTSEPASENQPVRKTRKTSRKPVADTSAPVRKSRRTAAPAKKSRRRKASATFDDLFGPDEKADFDAAVISARERLIVGDSEQSVLARLQSEGWNVKQSKHILGHARP